MKLPYRKASYAAAMALLSAASVLPITSSAAETGHGDAWRRPVTLSVAGQKSEGLTYVHPRQGVLNVQIPAMASAMRDAARSVVIRPAGDGKVMQVAVIPGQRIKKGDVLAVYRDHSLHTLYLERARAAAALASANAACAEAEKSYQRGLALKDSVVSRSEVERRWAVLQEQHASCAAAQANMDLMTHRLQEEFTSSTEVILKGEISRLIAPMDSVVQSVELAADDDIKAGSPVVTLVDLAHVWIVAHIRPQDAAALEVGGVVEARPAGHPDVAPFFAKISSIDGLADPATGLLGVTSVVDNREGRLRPGEMLDARLSTNAQVRGLILPIAALQNIDGQDVVFVRQGTESFTPRAVKVLLRTDDAVAVEGDLSPQIPIVSQGSFALKGLVVQSEADGQ